jgi:hypothetical protein
MWLARAQWPLLNRLDALFSHSLFTVPELLYLKKELISVQAKLLYGAYCLIRIQGRKAHEPDHEFSPISCRFLSPEEPTQSRSQPSSKAVSQSQSILSFFSRAPAPAPFAESAPSLSQPALSLSLTGPSPSPAVPTSTSSSTGLPSSQPSLSSNSRRSAPSPVLAPALPLPRYPKRDNRVQIGPSYPTGRHIGWPAALGLCTSTTLFAGALYTGP